MRFAFSVLVVALCIGSAAAQAAVVWSEVSNRGVPVTLWARGANLNEATAAAKARAGQAITVLQNCRQPGFYAYVGSAGQSQRGVVCGYETSAAAVLAARYACEHEGGRCDLEKVGYDDGKPIAGNAGDNKNLPEAVIADTASGGSTYTLNTEFIPDDAIMLSPFR